ncbi:ImmA/IrrE family metallo-endopeptidase [Mesobacillus stamsii]|uniref:Zn-dependent peptidase ImmA (M78 family) n=1 Tax=Mesobacillus stamsii TaxID=225347 RepID=A0ABU0FUL2_9BACI|nr:ImmA/IrrE family metallo-endopeptidase [Mesobacillus stamsii]MDQ0413022.1 Zn-dependent peptidase ImmA (M78 family) [Mesobacillus stamsii]
MEESAKYLSEVIGQKAALDIHAELFSELNTFIGHGLPVYIEKKGIHLIRKFIDDNETKEDHVAGGYIRLPDNTRVIFVNTKRNLREQLFTIAHEFWHHIEEKYTSDFSIFQDKDVSEHAGDHFAASLTMNAASVKVLFQRMVNQQYSLDEIIYFIADLSCMPYVSVLRRIKELKLFDELEELHKMDSNPFIKHLSSEFQNYRKKLLKNGEEEYNLENEFIQKRQAKLSYTHPLDISDGQELIFIAYDKTIQNVKEQNLLVDRDEKMTELAAEDE